MDRILQGTAATIYVAFTRAGVAEDPTPDSATVTITRSDGTALVTDGTALDVDDPAGVFGYTLTAAQTALLDTLTATWTVTYDGQPNTRQTVVEVAGDFLFSIADARAIPGGFADEDLYPTALIAAYRTLVETELEDACARAFVPRYTVETLSGSSTSSLWLSKPEPRAIRSVTVNGTAYTTGQVAEVTVDHDGLAWAPGTWPAGQRNIRLGYEYGPDFPPPAAKRHALTLLKLWLGGINRPIDDRAITFNTTDGGTYSLAVPGRNGSTFGHPDVDAWVQRQSLRTGLG